VVVLTYLTIGLGICATTLMLSPLWRTLPHTKGWPLAITVVALWPVLLCMMARSCWRAASR
jgi:hypothetical protein